MKKTILIFLLVLAFSSCVFCATPYDSKKFDIILRVNNGEISSLELMDFQAQNQIKEKELQIVPEEQELCAIKLRTNKSGQYTIIYSATPLFNNDNCYIGYQLNFKSGTTILDSLTIGTDPSIGYSTSIRITPTKENDTNFYSYVTSVTATIYASSIDDMPFGDYSALLTIERATV